MTQILKEMYEHNETQPQQKHGVIAILTKYKDANRLGDFRPLTILNTDFKILTRITVNRLRPWMPDLIDPTNIAGKLELQLFMHYQRYEM
jgi:hypothetical protein